MIDIYRKGNVPSIPAKDFLGKYILKGKAPVPCYDLHEWAMWFEKTDRRVAYARHKDVVVSTVFLGLDHGFPGTPAPLLFETMVFGGKYNGKCQRYATWDEARRGHESVCKAVFQ